MTNKSDWGTFVQWNHYQWCPKTCLLFRNGISVATCRSVHEAEDWIRKDTGYEGEITWAEPEE